MKFVIFVSIFSLTCLYSESWPLAPNQQSSLQLLHVLFRHGNRTANGPEELYPKDPYVDRDYFPIGLGQLTNAGKRREYSIGLGLRRDYNRFLGPAYYPEIYDARSTDVNRTKASLELALAGLFPPKEHEIWDPLLLWQPIPYSYYPADKDEILIGVNCPNYVKAYDEHVKTLQAEFNNYSEIFKYLTENTGKTISTFRDVYNLYFGLSTEEEFGLELPEWTKSVWPKNITDLAVKEYFVAMGTTQMRQIGVGYFLDKIIKDTEAKIQGKNKRRKIYLYSAHENNVAEFLLTLDIFNPPHVPNYGAYVVMEVHKMGDSHGFRIVYENYTKNKPQVLTLPGCEEICEISKFKSLVEKYMPTEGLCGNKKC